MSNEPKPEIRTVLEFYGVEIPTTNMNRVKMRCFLPGHEDATPSAALYEAKGYFKCFTCDRSLDSWGVIQEMENCDFRSALTIGAEKFNVQHGSVSPAASKPRRRTPLRISERGAGSGPRDDTQVQARSRPRRKRLA